MGTKPVASILLVVGERVIFIVTEPESECSNAANAGGDINDDATTATRAVIQSTWHNDVT